MKLRNYREAKQPDLNIIPMIDIMFFLLVFFMLSTMYMVEQKTIPVNLPQATSAAIDNKTNFTVTLKDDGSIYLEDQQTDIQTLLMQATKEQKNNPSFAIIIRADKDINYDKVVSFIDTLKKAGITRFGLATNGAGGN
ncbi:ExbD/TolR family protein [Megamonas funiformis]|uniref:ExbD/TolR family protein n=1 Tax=Megamonas funiformis TaxID=437897 RepID=UPI0022DFDD25|nr:biopolymer transporter ExbD [Megamonas funiformis]